MALSIAHKNRSMMAILPDIEVVEIDESIKIAKPKSIYTLAREARFEKAALKKYDARIKEIQKYFPNWNPQ